MTSPALNKERIRQLADVIEKVPHAPLNTRAPELPTMDSFNMGVWHCGTAGCIAGWTTHLYVADFDEWEGHAQSAALALGVEDDDADALFMPGVANLAAITPSQAAQTLRKLADTGKVDWSHVEQVSP